MAGFETGIGSCRYLELATCHYVSPLELFPYSRLISVCPVGAPDVGSTFRDQLLAVLLVRL